MAASGTGGFAARVLHDVQALKNGELTAATGHLAAMALAHERQAAKEVQDAETRHGELYWPGMKQSKTEL